MREKRSACKVSMEKFKKKDRYEDLGVDVRIILKWTLKT
jgi:hypothetical protein